MSRRSRLRDPTGNCMRKTTTSVSRFTNTQRQPCSFLQRRRRPHVSAVIDAPIMSIRAILAVVAIGVFLRGAPEAQSPALLPQFSDVTSSAGIHFRHTSGAFGKKYLPE